jgi:hypothetical protein
MSCDEGVEMKKLLCWLLGHDRMTTSASRRVCLRCGVRETRRNFGSVIAWEEQSPVAIRGSRA